MLSLLDEISCAKTDGHFTIMRFSTGYKVFLGTPSDIPDDERDQLKAMESHSTLTSAIKDAIKKHQELF